MGGDPVSQKHEQLVELLSEVNRGVIEYIRKDFKKRDMPFTLMIIMKEIWHEPGITISELARRSGIVKSHVSGMVEQGIALGRIEKRKDPADQRVVRLYVSESAMKPCQELRESMRQRLAELVSGFPEDKTEGLIEGLSALKTVLESAREQEGQE